MKIEKMGIIGFGNFGKLMARHLSKKFDVVVTDSSNSSREAKDIGVKFGSMENVLKCRMIILAVPMEVFVDTLKNIKDKLREDAIVLDVCSLKMFSCKAMEFILPENVQIIGMHPLFGPQSSGESLRGLRMVLCDVRSEKETFTNVKNFCEKEFGLNVFVRTPEEHDKEMAVSQALTHFIGQIIKKAGIKRVELTTKTFDNLMNVMEIIGNDTRALFENMETMNPFARDVREKFLIEGMKLHEKLNFLEDSF